MQHIQFLLRALWNLGEKYLVQTTSLNFSVNSFQLCSFGLQLCTISFQPILSFLTDECFMFRQHWPDGIILFYGVYVQRKHTGPSICAKIAYWANLDLFHCYFSLIFKDTKLFDQVDHV